MSNPSTRAGFTLIELSIVLVIIGLLVGGILTGQDLIKAAEVRKQISLIDSIDTVVQTFRTKYECLPGDCVNATDYFGENATYCTSHNTDAAPEGTCNGNGDGIAGDYDYVNNQTIYEREQFFQQILLSGLSNLPWVTSLTTGPNQLPPSILFKGKQSIKFTQYGSGEYDGWTNYAFKTHNWVIDPDPSQSATALGLFDMKFDDGNAFTGKIRVSRENFSGDPSECIDYLTGVYHMSGGAKMHYCQIYISMGF